jgi:uracil-DNA glycosylase
MFIGEAPTKEDEGTGRPFTGKSGQIVRKIIEKIGINRYYLTNLVTCRACRPASDATGQPILRKNWKTKQMEVFYRDETPTPLQIDACRTRLEEQIYIVDPIIIVTLGPIAAKTVLKKHVNIMAPEVRGQPFHASIPGAGFSSVRTEKKNAWVRTVAGKTQLPIEQSEVRYLCIPTLLPSFVDKKIADVSTGSPFRQLAGDIQKAAQIYERYMLETYGDLPKGVTEGELEFTDEELLGPDPN